MKTKQSPHQLHSEQLQPPYTHQRRLAGILLGKQPPVRIADAVHLLMSESFCYYNAIGG
jgi:hypothetical protein